MEIGLGFFDYEKVLDNEIQDFIKECKTFDQGDDSKQPIAKSRLAYDAMCASFNSGRPRSVIVKDLWQKKTKYKTIFNATFCRKAGIVHSWRRACSRGS